MDGYRFWILWNCSRLADSASQTGIDCYLRICGQWLSSKAVHVCANSSAHKDGKTLAQNEITRPRKTPLAQTLVRLSRFSDALAELRRAADWPHPSLCGFHDDRGFFTRGHRSGADHHGLYARAEIRTCTEGGQLYSQDNYAHLELIKQSRGGCSWAESTNHSAWYIRSFLLCMRCA